MPYTIAVDSGGTFCDCVIVDDEGRVIKAKASTTPDNFAEGILQSVSNAAGKMGFSLGDLLATTRRFCVGTTVATNALITRNGIRTGLITTKGHEDALIIGRISQKVAGLSEIEIINVSRLEKADPIIPRPLIQGVTERCDWRGEVVVRLDEDEARAALQKLMAMDCRSLAICFLWSFANPTHERRLRDIAQEIAPELFVTLSSDLAPVMKEYERTATTAMNAYVSPIVKRFIVTLSQALEHQRFRGTLLTMGSMGGMMSQEETAARGIATLCSGPAGGVISAAALGRHIEEKNIITTDVGGTSFDVGLVVDGEPVYAETPIYDKYTVLLPTVDVVSVGAGGGSIAWIEADSGILHVGPQSAGASPGPVCYGKGGSEPTVTDADVVLGRINPENFLGGAITLDRDRAVSVIESKIAKLLRMGIAEAAMAIIDIVDAHMADLVRKVTIGRGYDPREFVLFAFGGGGPTHVGAYAHDVQVRKVVIPSFAGVFSAYGIAGADVVHIRNLTEPMEIPVESGRAEQIIAELEHDVTFALRREGFDDSDIRLECFVSMRYKGQVHELFVPIGRDRGYSFFGQRLEHVFERVYEQKYGKGTAYKPAGIEVITFRVRGTGLIPRRPPQPEVEKEDRSTNARVSQRQVYFRELGGYVPTAIYDAGLLEPGSRLEGPAIVEALDTTVPVHPGQQLRIDGFRNIILTAR